MSFVVDVLTSVENLREELGKVFSAAEVLDLKYWEAKAALERGRRLDDLVRHRLFNSPHDLETIQHAKDLTESIRLGMLLFSIQNGLPNENPCRYTLTVSRYLAELEREAKK